MFCHYLGWSPKSLYCLRCFAPSWLLTSLPLCLPQCLPQTLLTSLQLKSRLTSPEHLEIRPKEGWVHQTLAFQHPASRGYDVLRGYDDPQDPKTLPGTTLALRSLSLLDVASDSGCPGLLEQPRRTKMRRLEEWQRLLELQRAHEVWTAGCMFGSIHNKEFVFLYCNLDGGKLHRNCDGGHQHVRIEGQYTKKSAVYLDELAETIACEFDAALTRKLRYEGACSVLNGGQFLCGLGESHCISTLLKPGLSLLS